MFLILTRWHLLLTHRNYCTLVDQSRQLKARFQASATLSTSNPVVDMLGAYAETHIKSALYREIGSESASGNHDPGDIKTNSLPFSLVGTGTEGEYRMTYTWNSLKAHSIFPGQDLEANMIAKLNDADTYTAALLVRLKHYGEIRGLATFLAVSDHTWTKLEIEQNNFFCDSKCPDGSWPCLVTDGSCNTPAPTVAPTSPTPSPTASVG